ncbi:MAG: ribonuclease III [Oscillospiraceae bacterium]|jgi:ribonuclease-3 family protein|nr:ribonuclease III [Oscillospiraceae bacterium]
MHNISSLGLAYIGDGIYELMVRERVCALGALVARQMHRQTVRHTNAAAQAIYSRKLEPFLTEQERGVWRRGRNAASVRSPKNATDGEYHLATALEAVFGWLYLSGNMARIRELFGALDIGGAEG